MEKNSLESRWDDFYQNAGDAAEFGILIDFTKEACLHFYQKRANKEEIPFDEISTFINKFYKLRLMIDKVVGYPIDQAKKSD